MRVAISIAEHEIEMAHRWFDWVCELGGTDGHHLHLIPAAGVDIKDLLPKADKAFGRRVNIIVDYEAQTSDWQIAEPMRSASGPNSSFRQIAWHFYMNKLGPFFWCELDCIPTKKDWLDKLEAEYKVALSKGKVFMGAQVLLDSVPEHMSGNAVYPQNVPEAAPTIVMRTEWTPKGQEQSFELAFDIAGARETVPKAHFTNLIQHKFRYEGFKSRAEFDAVIDPNAVVFHSDKSGSIYKYLRENLSGGATENYFDGSNDTTRKDYENICDGAREANILGGTKAEPVPLQDNLSGGVADIPSPKRTTVTSPSQLEAVIAQNSLIRNGLPAMSPPWENREDTERDVQMLCNALALFCKAPVYKSRVRNALREAKIIK